MRPAPTRLALPARPRFLAVLAAPALAAVLALASPAAAAGPDEVAGELARLNGEFRGLYQKETAAVLARQPLLLVVDNAGVTAIRNGERKHTPIDMGAYQETKALLHGVLAFQAVMRGAQAAGAKADWDGIAAYVGQLEKGRSLLPETKLPPPMQQAVGEIYATLIAAATRAQARHEVTAADITAPLATVRPKILTVARWIGRQHGEQLRAALLAVRESVGAEAWSQAVAVVPGPPTARRDNLEAAVVASVLGERALGRRIFYAEGVFTVDAAMPYLQTVLGDAAFSRDLFGNETRMWRDLFGEVSRGYVKQDFYTPLAR